MVNRIGGSYSNYYNYQNTIGQIKLKQAISKNPNYQNYQKQVQRTQADIYRDNYRSSSMNFLRDYTSTMSDVMQSANSLRSSNSAGVMNALTAVSSDTKVADVTARYDLRQARDMDLNVTQVAVAQQNRSNGAVTKEAAVEDMAFAITGSNGRYDVNISAVKEDGTAKTNGEMLKEAADAINKSNVGVKASIEEQDGSSVLSLQGKETGTEAAFEVTGQLGAAEGMDKIAAEAADAKYSVTENGRTREYTSQSNSVQLDAGRLQAELKEAGSTKISAQPDMDKIASSVSKMLDSYNKARNFLGDNTTHGRGAIVALRNFERSLTSEQAMKRLGVSQDESGKLTLDEQKLKDSLTKEPSLTRQLLSGSNGLAQNLYNRGVSAMNTNSASLISNDLQEITQSSIFDPIQQTNLYSRNGAYTANNYAALGVMMNYLV
ncbi:MAG: flagellar filament capping protein FliD [Firmicutes bacterium]|nr:flagellar filament capping protein FliD [Bacillota bacterium]